MPRAARVVLVDSPLHIVQRGINRSTCFFSEGDYLSYLRYLALFSRRFGCSVHAYCLMTNHVHLLLTPHTTEACALLMKNLGQHYVQGVNHRLARTGTLWEGRFHSSLVTSARYVLACYRYIELNPVRAGIVPRANQYRWSSHDFNLQGQPAGFLKMHSAYEALATDADQRGRLYQEMCELGTPAAELKDIRQATRVDCAIGMRRKGRGRPRKLDEKNRVRPYL